MKFDELNIDERILRAVEDMGFEETSPIQTQAIPAVLEGIDVIGQAQTGTGKTAAYSIPVLQKINPDVKKPQAIVLCPTRELAVQVAEEIRKLAKYMSDIKVLPVYGGQEIVRQIKSLKAGVQIIVGTPGRIDCVESWAIFVEQPEGHYRVRLRSKSIVINEIAKRHDGGGHPLASGANSYSLEENEQIYREIKDTVAHATH